MEDFVLRSIKEGLIRSELEGHKNEEKIDDEPDKPQMLPDELLT